MRGLIYFVIFFWGFALVAQDLILKDIQIPWQGLTLRFPEDVVIKNQDLTHEKILQVFPARREPFMIVLRKLPIQNLNFAKKRWEEEIFWRAKNQESTELERGGTLFKIYKCDQVRNQNLLRGNLWLWSKKENHYWVWILFRKDRADLLDFFENAQFLIE